MHLREPAPAPSQMRPGLPPELDQLVARCLAKDPAHRFSTAAELAIAIGGLLGSSPQVAAARPAGYAAGTEPTTLSSAMGAVGAAPPRRSRAALIATLTVAIAGVVVAIAVTRGAAPAKLGPAGCVRHPPIQPRVHRERAR